MDYTSMNAFHTRLRFLRDEKGYTQEELGKILNRTRVTINNWEKDSFPEARDVFDLAKLFNVSTDYLLGITDTRSPDDSIRNVREFLEYDEETLLHLKNIINDIKYSESLTNEIDRAMRLDALNRILSNENLLYDLADVFRSSVAISDAKRINKYAMNKISFDFRHYNQEYSKSECQRIEKILNKDANQEKFNAYESLSSSIEEDVSSYSFFTDLEFKAIKKANTVDEIAAIVNKKESVYLSSCLIDKGSILSDQIIDVAFQLHCFEIGSTDEKEEDENVSSLHREYMKQQLISEGYDPNDIVLMEDIPNRSEKGNDDEQ